MKSRKWRCICFDNVKTMTVALCSCPEVILSQTPKTIFSVCFHKLINCQSFHSPAALKRTLNSTMSSCNLFSSSLLSSTLPKISFSFFSPPSFSPPLFCPSNPFFSLQIPRSSPSLFKLTSHKSFADTHIDEFRKDEAETEFDESDSEDYAIDIEELEEEAEDVVREFSTSLSRQLRIGRLYLILFLSYFIFFSG